MNRLKLLVTLLFAASLVQAQQLSLFTQYRENAEIINPAAVHGDYLVYGNGLNFNASYRTQWVDVANSPTTQTLKGSYILDQFSGVNLKFGGYLINDQTGPTGFTGLYGHIGGIVSPNPEYGGLVVAISAGAVQYRVNSSEIFLKDPGDIVGTQDQSQIFPDVGVGVYYYQMLSGSMDGDYIYMGLSVPQTLGLELRFKEGEDEFLTRRVQHFYGMFGLIKFFDNDSFLEPSLWVKYAPNVPVNVDFNLRYQLPSNIWVGTGLSTAANVHLETGFQVGENLKLGYGFDYSFSSFGPSVGSTHELNIGLTFDR